MHLILDGFIGACCFVIAGAIVVVRQLAPLRMRIQKLEASLALLPLARATDNIKRIDVALSGLQRLAERIGTLRSRLP